MRSTQFARLSSWKLFERASVLEVIEVNVFFGYSYRGWWHEILSKYNLSDYFAEGCLIHVEDSLDEGGVLGQEITLLVHLSLLWGHTSPIASFMIPFEVLDQLGAWVIVGVLETQPDVDTIVELLITKYLALLIGKRDQGLTLS
jgi:hypothetical protein